MKIDWRFPAEVGFNKEKEKARNIMRYILPHCPATSFSTDFHETESIPSSWLLHVFSPVYIVAYLKRGFQYTSANHMMYGQPSVGERFEDHMHTKTRKIRHQGRKST